MNLSLEQAVQKIQEGDPSLLEDVVAQIQNKVYALALRMLWHTEDARDATQEILLRVCKNLGSFRGESAFMTWVYRVAANYLKTARRSRLEERNYTFERFGRELDEGLSDAVIPNQTPVDEALLLEEIKIGCTLGMLLCLDRPHRLAYILGEILELKGPEAAMIGGISQATFRKRLSRARSDIVHFMRMKCGLIHPQNPCRCRRRIHYALKTKRLNPRQLLFAQDVQQARHFPTVLAEIRKLEEAQRSAALYRAHPQTALPDGFASAMKSMLTGLT